MWINQVVQLVQICQLEIYKHKQLKAYVECEVTCPFKWRWQYGDEVENPRKTI